MRQIQLKANFQPKPKKWSKVELIFLMKYYPLYKAGSMKWTASTLRGNLSSRTMKAIANKYWCLTGHADKKVSDVKQYKFDFAQDLLK